MKSPAFDVGDIIQKHYKLKLTKAGTAEAYVRPLICLRETLKHFSRLFLGETCEWCQEDQQCPAPLTTYQDQCL